MPIEQLIFRLALAYVSLLILARLMGRKEISQLTFFNFVSAIAIGTIGASLAIDSALSIRNGMIALVGWSAFTIMLGWIDIKSKSMRKVIEGQPLIVIKNGAIMEGQLKKARLDIDALNALLRQKNVFNISDVSYAIFETDGQLSVMKKETKQTATKSEMPLPPKQPIYTMSAAVISDGSILKSNLEKLQLDQAWLQQQLQSSGIEDISDVFYAEVQQDGTLYIDKKGDILRQ